MARTPDERVTPRLAEFVYVGTGEMDEEDVAAHVAHIRRCLATNMPVVLQDVVAEPSMEFNEESADIVRGNVYGEVEVIGMLSFFCVFQGM